VVQCAAVCGSVLQGVAVCCSIEIYRWNVEKVINKSLRNMCTQWLVAVCCNVLQCAAVCCSVLQCVAVCCSVLQRILQCVAG